MHNIEALLSKFPWLRTISEKDLRLLYGVRILRDLLNKITLFFLPIFLFTLGRESDLLNILNLTPLQKGMVMIGIFYGLARLSIFLSAIPLAQFSRRFGFEVAVMFSYVLRLGVFACLFYTKQMPELILVAAILEGIQCNLFWNSFFTVLSERIHRKWAGSELGLMQFVVQLLAVLTPALTGYLAYQYGFDILFLLGSVISVVSAVMVFSLHLKVPRDEVNWGEFFQWLKDPVFFRLTGSFIGRYFNDAVLLLWPLYVFLLLGSIDEVGFLYTFSLFLAMLLTFFIGGYLNKHHSKKPFYFSGAALSLIWLARMNIFTIWGVALADMSERLFANFHWLFYDWVVMIDGKGRQAFSYFVYREIVMSVGAIIFWCIFTSFFMVTSSWNGIFIFGGIGVLLSLLISDNHDR